MRFLLELAVGDVGLGGKARSLAALAGQGMPTPPGFVISDDLIRALCPDLPVLHRLDQDALARLDQARDQLAARPWPAGFSAELHRRMAGLPADRFAVRSSFVSEDRPGSLAAGVYESRLDVATASVEQAIREVLASALSPGAVAYALAHGQNPTAGPLAVLVHAYVPGIAEGSAALAGDLAAEPLLTVRRGELAPEERQAIGQTLARLRVAQGPLEIEWVHTGDRLSYLQARPFVAPPPAVVWTGWRGLGDVEEAAAWRWDSSHNPLPLSPAQRGLVELVDGRCSIGVRQRVLGGYLFDRKDERPLPPAIPSEAAGAFCASLRARLDAGLAALGPSPGLAAALELFVSVYEPIFGVLQPALRSAHRRLRELIEGHAPAALALLPALRTAVPSLAGERLRLAHRMGAAQTPSEREGALRVYLRQFGDEAPLWDVVAPTYGEAPDTVLAHLPSSLAPAAEGWRQASAEVEPMLAPGLRDEWRTVLGLSRAAVALGEEDDWLYARAQAAVRRALLAVGRRLAAAGTLSEAQDVCYLPLDLVRGIASGVAPPAGLAYMAAAGRRDWQVALANPPPSPAAMHQPGLQTPQRPDTVLVARTLLPTELPLLSAVALVCETGGVLDHVAAQARERGIPAVVSAHGATDELAEGDLVLVDGERGLVVRMVSSR
jgi:phosphohistidine swiveling domain-containing protein